MRNYEFEAIGTHWWLEIVNQSGEFTPSLIDRITETTEIFNARYSRFRDSSLVSKLYKQGQLHNPPQEMVRMLRYARQMYRHSHGVFDITIGNYLHHLGYGQQLQSTDFDALKFWNDINISDTTIHCMPGIMLDFGGFGKGWLIDVIVNLMNDAGIKEYIVNGGGDLYVKADSPIEIALENPYDSSLLYGTITLKNSALAGSSTIKRVWRNDDKLQHHIIDPRTSKPSRSAVIASYVTAPTALVADTLATIYIIRPDLERELNAQYEATSLLIPAERSM